MKNKFAAKSLFNSCLLATMASLPWIPSASGQSPLSVSKLNVGDGTGSTAGEGTIVAEGRHGTSSPLASAYQTTGSRMLWYPRKSAFRAGYGDASTWSESTMGPYSVATGRQNIASGYGSTAMGYFLNTASGEGSTAMGFVSNTASGRGSTAMGYYLNTASGDGSTAIGHLNNASGFLSTAMGESNQADSSYSTVIGRWNVGGGDTFFWNSNDPLFEIGNGNPERYYYVGHDDDGDGHYDWVEDFYDSELRSNALTVYKNGNMNLQGSLTLGGTITSGGSPVLTQASALSDGFVNSSNFNSKLATSTPPTSPAWTSAYTPRGNVSPLAGQTIGGYLALGNSTASGQYSTAAGEGTASGNYSSATGTGTTTASGSYARANGYNTLASGLYSTANGNAAVASGWYSFSNGWGTSAKSADEVAFGRYNLESAPAGGLVVNGLDGLFRLGNGSSAARSDAMTVLKSGLSTLTNKEWKAAVVASPGNMSVALANPASTTDSDGNALIVDGHTVLNGKVIISVPQGDISMGIYQ